MTEKENALDPEAGNSPLSDIPDKEPPGAERADTEGEDFKIRTAPELDAEKPSLDINYLEADFEWTEKFEVGESKVHKEKGNVWTDFSTRGRQEFLRTLSAPKLRGIAHYYGERIDDFAARKTAAETACAFIVAKENK